MKNPNNAHFAPNNTYALFTKQGASSLAFETWVNYFGFSNYDTDTLASFLGVSVCDLARADFIAFDHNANGSTAFHPSQWVFSDGSPTGDVGTVIWPSTNPRVITDGSVSSSNYATYFGISDAGGRYAFLLFDINDTVNVASNGMNVQVAAKSNTVNSLYLDCLGVMFTTLTNTVDPDILSVSKSNLTINLSITGLAPCDEAIIEGSGVLTATGEWTEVETYIPGATNSLWSGNITNFSNVGIFRVKGLWNP
ncbi:MAG: hypothetical protein KJ626_15575 [Verrucomicrobia bacterium]|nr:hypothetical protein [Verrucomicrobiota bacterium]